MRLIWYRIIQSYMRATDVTEYRLLDEKLWHQNILMSGSRAHAALSNEAISQKLINNDEIIILCSPVCQSSLSTTVSIQVLYIFSY